ncbi:hypothetical protein GCM10023184_22530 [Flaviaesturariibacter amylovorans]|uniref:Uncharacterized protein n=1 Tax=Flaviaesturariibacter amylovorans TaxID=1084520 RepID=A0ABP8GWN3_9BACT
MTARFRKEATEPGLQACSYFVYWSIGLFVYWEALGVLAQIQKSKFKKILGATVRTTLQIL